MAYVEQILDSGWLTNRGKLVLALESRLQDYLGVDVILTNNATLALQVAYRTLGVSGEAITTPFTFIATSSSLVWEGIDVVFADIEKQTFNIDVADFESKITERTTAIVPVPVFGNPCDIKAINRLAGKHGLKVIYDSAHAFGINLCNESVFNQGEISIFSIYATKLFHAI